MDDLLTQTEWVVPALSAEEQARLLALLRDMPPGDIVLRPASFESWQALCMVQQQRLLTLYAQIRGLRELNQRLVAELCKMLKEHGPCPGALTGKT